MASNITLKQTASTGGSSNTSSISATFPSSHTGRGVHTFLVAVAHGDSSSSNVDSITGIIGLDLTWTQLHIHSRSATPVTGEIWYAQRYFAAAEVKTAYTIMVNWINATKGAIAVAEFVGIADGFSGAVNPKDKISVNDGSSVTPDSGTTATTSRDFELWLSMFASGTDTNYSGGVSNGYTILENVASTGGTVSSRLRDAFGYKIVELSGTANTSATLSSSRPWAGLGLTLYEEYNIYPGRDFALPSAAFAIPAPTVENVVGGETINVMEGQIASAAFSAVAPQLTATIYPTPDTAAWTTVGPTVTPGGVNIDPTPVTAAWTTVGPTVTPGGATIDLNAGEPVLDLATWSTVAPTVTPQPVNIDPTPVTAAFTMPAPTVAAATVNIDPTPVAATFGMPAPTIGTGAPTIVPDPVTAAWATVAPQIDASIAAAPVVASWSMPAPTIVTSGFIEPDSVTAAFAIPAPTVTPGVATITPTPDTASFTIPAPSLAGAGNIDATPVVAAFGVATPAITPGAVNIFGPASVTAGWTTVAPQLDAVVAAQAAVASWGVVGPMVTAGAVTVTPTPPQGTFNIPAPTIVAGAAVEPTPVSAAFAIPAPTVAVGAVAITSSPYTASWGVLTPDVAASAGELAPTPVAVSFVVPAPTMDAVTPSLAPDPVAGVFGMPVPTVTPGMVGIGPTPLVGLWIVPPPVVVAGLPVDQGLSLTSTIESTITMQSPATDATLESDLDPDALGS